MSVFVKPSEELENQVHDQLFQLITQLTLVYPTTKDFDAVLKEKMFVKINRDGFHQVIYYLLGILTPDLVEEKITAWPPYDVMLEGQFRNEVYGILKQIHILYPDSNIPCVKKSYLSSPAGFKFAKFMLKLTQLAVYKYLKENEEVELELLDPAKAHKDPAITNLVVKSIQQSTIVIEAETVALYQGFIERTEEMTEEADVAFNCYTQATIDLKQLEEKTEETFENNELELHGSITQRITSLQDRLSIIKIIKDLCVTFDELLTYLINEDLVLKYEKLESEKEKLDLLKFFKSLNAKLEALEFLILTEHRFEEMISEFDQINASNSGLHEELTKQSNEITEEKEIVKMICNDNTHE